MSEDYDDVTYGPITFERAKHHLRCLAVDCDWRASEVDEYVNAQAEMMARLRAEVKAWRDSRATIALAGRRQVVEEARAAVDAANALEGP